MFVKNNFLVVSNYNNNIDWVKKYSDNYIIYDRSDSGKFLDSFDKDKIIKSPNLGYNLYDYFSFIVENYDNLPKNIAFIKGNVFPRHVSEDFFRQIVNNNFFTSIVEAEKIKTKKPINFISADGGYFEVNNSWYTDHFKTKYFNNFDEFMGFCFDDYVSCDYISFAPGANYIVPKENILKLPKNFYKNLIFFLSHESLPGEAHIMERALYILWNYDLNVSEKMIKCLDDQSADVISLINNKKKLSFKKIAVKIKYKILSIF